MKSKRSETVQEEHLYCKIITKKGNVSFWVKKYNFLDSLDVKLTGSAVLEIDLRKNSKLMLKIGMTAVFLFPILNIILSVLFIDPAPLFPLTPVGVVGVYLIANISVGLILFAQWPYLKSLTLVFYFNTQFNLFKVLKRYFHRDRLQTQQLDDINSVRGLKNAQTRVRYITSILYLINTIK